MSLTILDVLRNVAYNLNEAELNKDGLMPMRLSLAKEQLKNALYLIDEHDKELLDDFEESLLNEKD